MSMQEICRDMSESMKAHIARNAIPCLSNAAGIPSRNTGSPMKENAQNAVRRSPGYGIRRAGIRNIFACFLWKPSIFMMPTTFNNTIASLYNLTGDGVVGNKSFSMKSELEGEWAVFAPIDRDTLQRRFSLVGLPTLVFAFAPGFHPVCTRREVNSA